MAKGQKSQIVTKKHLARQQRERLQNRYILIASIAVIVLVVGLIGYGIVQQYIIQPNQPVAKVGNQDITTKQFQTFARYERVQWIRQYQNYEQLAQYFGSDQATMSYIQQLMSQVDYQLQPTNIGQNAIDYLVANQIIQNEADKRGITVSASEIDQVLQDALGYYPNGTPTTAPTTVPVPTSTLNPTQIALIPPTATAIPTSTAIPTPTITVTQIVVSPTPTILITPLASATALAPTVTSTPAPSPTPYTTQEYATNFQTFLSNMKSVASLTESDLRWIFTMQQLRQKVLDAVTADISRQQDEVWARHIVVSDQTQSQSIYDRLTKGENFETVATEVYSGTTNTIDLGWFGKDTLDPNAQNIVWDMQIGQISQPIQTANGWEIYQVLGHEVRTLNDSDFDTLKQTEFQKWIDAQKTTENVQTFDTWKTKVPTSPTIPPTQTGQ
jgi:PPIC-type PPIASE domain/SurA-like N-terminal domain